MIASVVLSSVLVLAATASDEPLERGRSLTRWLLKLHEHSTPYTMLAASDAIVRLGRTDKAVVERLLGDLETVDARGREDLIFVLGQMGAQARPAVPRITRALRDEVDRVRGAAAQALGEIGADGETTIPALINTLDDTDEAVRAVAIRALGRFARAVARRHS